MQIYLYKVPPLDFKGEDISLEFMLTVKSGETPKMFAALCKQQADDVEKCTKGISIDKLTSAKYDYQQAKAVGKALSLIIDHDENTC